MLINWRLKFQKFFHSLSLRAAIFAIGAIGVALVANFFSEYVPESLAELLGGEAVDRILAILSSSMLVVVTFSLATLITSFSVLGAGAPPRATALIMQDSRAHTALSTFLGAFIFSIVSLIALSTKYYGRNGRVILFFITILVLTAVIWKIIGWIGHLSGLGQLRNIINRIEIDTKKAVCNDTTFFAWSSNKMKQAPESSVSVCCDTKVSGFLQHIDFRTLSKLADLHDTEMFINITVGEYIYPGSILAKIDQNPENEKLIDQIKSCFFIGEQRTFQNDPRFGFIVLSEIGSRALSPGINDPGTAIEVICSLQRMILFCHSKPGNTNQSELSKKLHFRRIESKEMFNDAFHAIARDGAGNVEVGVFLQRSLRSLGQFAEFSEAALLQSAEALDRNQKSLTSNSDMLRVTRAAQR